MANWGYNPTYRSYFTPVITGDVAHLIENYPFGSWSLCHLSGLNPHKSPIVKGGDVVMFKL